MDLSVIILNWNTCALLEKCLHSLECPQPGIVFEVLVVDNASEDGSREMVRDLFPHVRLKVNPTNIGFGAGNNSGISGTAGRYILFLNSDTVVLEGSLSRLVQYADSRPEVGIVGPKLLNEDGSLQYSCRRYPSLGAGFFRNTPLGRLFPHNRYAADYLMQDWDHSEPRDVDWVSGAALMIRRRLVEQIGAFDEDFFMYCEDVDLCWRANHAPHPDLPGQNWRVAYYPGAVIYHFIGKSSDQVPTRMTYEFHRSQYLFYKKHYAASMFPLLRPLIPVGIAARAVGQLVRYQWRNWKKRLRGEPLSPHHRRGGDR
ncbi:MAG: glycosyltransferase family 2 protein [Chloroherpetonaceae bacterium]|nr:glycosyltransferase family 2 protein [Chthonomonadaceae bacterium]MDW8208703.1 glycosyltransferase family 2 protein [Chloroherpetonaceae bacterium]